MKRVLFFLLASVVTMFGQVSSVQVDPTGHVIGPYPVNFDIGGLQVNGVNILGGGGALPWKSVVDYGAVADDATDNTAAFNAAIAAAGPTGIIFVPPGTYRILGQIELNGGDRVNWPARLVGAGNKLSALHIAWPNTQTVGTIQAARGATVSDLRFIYDQPDPGGDMNHVPPILPDYSVFHHYQPVIYVNQTFIVLPAFGTPEYGGKGFYRGGRYERLRIENAWDGITCVGGIFDNSLRPWFGQEIFDDLEMGTLNRGISLDMMTDSIYINRLRLFPYGMTGNQETAQRLPGHSAGIYAGNVVDARITDSFFLTPALDAHPGLNGDGVHLHFVNCSFDTYGYVNILGGTGSAGQTTFTNCRFGNSSLTQDSLIKITNHDVYFTGCDLLNDGNNGLDGIVISDSPSANRVVSFGNCKFSLRSNDASAVVGSGNLIITGCQFVRTATATFASPAIHVTGGRATITGNQGTPMTTGSGVFLDLDLDDFHTISGNDAPGWTMIYPATPVLTQSYGNSMSTVSPGSAGQNLSMGIKKLFVEGGSTGKLTLSSGAGSPETVVTADPGSLYLNTSGGIYFKQTGTGNTGWLAPGGGGTVTNFSAGDLTPLFTTTEATTTTTPALSFALTNAAANSWFGNATGSSAAPAYNTSVFPAALMPALTGPVTTTAGGVATTITNGAVTYAKMQNVSANSRLLGSGSAGTGLPPAEITVGSGLTMTGTTLTAAAGGGTVTNTGGNLTANSVMLGAGVVDSKVVAGIITDGTSKLTLGVSTTSVGSIALNNLTSGSVTIQPATGALSTATMTIPAGSTNPVVADTGAASNFLTGISTAGVITKAQPAFSNLTGSATAAQMPAYTGDVTSPAGSTVNTLANIPDLTPAVGSILFTNIAAPTAPASTKDKVWFDTTDQRLHEKNTAGTIGTTAVAKTSVASQWLNSMSASGVFTSTQPAFTDLTGSVAATQMPALTGDVTTVAGAVATTIGANKVTLGMMATMATDSILGRKTAATGNVEVLTALPWADTGDVTRTADGTATVLANIPLTTTIAGVAGTRGDVLYYGASGWAKLGAGTSGNQLTTNGAGADPTWAAPGSGGGGTPGGSNTQVQWNNASAFGGISSWTTDGTVMTLTGTSKFKIIGASGGTGVEVGSLADTFSNDLNIRNASANNRTTLMVMPRGTVANIPATFQFYGTDAIADAANYERLVIYAKGTSNNTYQIQTQALGTGSRQPLSISADSTETELRLNTDGSVTVGTTGTPIGNGNLAVQNVLMFGGGIDTGLYRNAAGVVEVNNGTAGTYKTLKDDVTNSVTGFQVNGAAPTNYELTGNGTNFVSKASDIPNGSSAQQTGFSANTYLTGSLITINAGDFKIGSTYRCMFDMTKTTAGTAAPVITIYIGTNGSTADTAAQTITFAAATGVADTGMFEVWVNFRAVGASATIASVGTCMHNLAATGLTSTGAAGTATVSNTTSSTFSSTAATKIGVAFNGGTSYVGTNNIVQAYYSNP